MYYKFTTRILKFLIGAIICVTVVDRLHHDTLKTQKQIFLSPKAFREYEMRTFKLASAYFKDRLANIANNK